MSEMNEEQPVVADANQEAQQEVEKIKKEMLYLKADFDNYRKRLIKDTEQSVRFANERLIRELLGPIDLFEKALKAGATLKSNNESKNFYLGIEMTHKEISQLLTKQGLEFFGEAGESFDPTKHEAISQIESDVKEEKVSEVLQRGATYHGRLLQPAKVVVAKPKSKD